MAAKAVAGEVHNGNAGQRRADAIFTFVHQAEAYIAAFETKKGRIVDKATIRECVKIQIALDFANLDGEITQMSVPQDKILGTYSVKTPLGVLEGTHEQLVELVRLIAQAMGK